MPRLGLGVDVTSGLSLRGEVRLSANGIKLDHEVTVAFYGVYLGIVVGL